MVPHKCCCFMARFARGQIQGGDKIGRRVVPLLANFFRPDGHSNNVHILHLNALMSKCFTTLICLLNLRKTLHIADSPPVCDILLFSCGSVIQDGCLASDLLKHFSQFFFTTAELILMKLDRKQDLNVTFSTSPLQLLNGI